MQIPGWKWFPLLKGFPPPSRAKRGEVKRNTTRVSAPSCESHDARSASCQL